MNDLVAKISSYNLFNNLVPGAVFAFVLTALDVYPLSTSTILVDATVYYFLGMVISRIGSVVIDPVLKWLGVTGTGDYGDFIDASAKDEKILILLETGNFYRTTLALVLVSMIAYNAKMFAELRIPMPLIINIVFLLLAIIFMLSYRKMNAFISRRVIHYKENHHVAS